MFDRFQSQRITNINNRPKARQFSFNQTYFSQDKLPKEEIISQIKEGLEVWGTVGTAMGAITTNIVMTQTMEEVQEIAEPLGNDNESLEQGYGMLIGLVLSIIAAIIWYVRKRTQRKTSYGQVKIKLNDWYHRFAVASLACQNIATIVFSFIPPLLSPLKRLLSYVVGSLVGLIVVIITSHIQCDQPLLTLGKKEGWSNYMFTGGGIGALVGAAIGGIIGLLIPLPFTMPIGIALGSAIGGLLGSVGTGIAVPVINKIYPERDTSYRLGYAKTGALLGSTIGGILGFIIGFLIPLPGTALVFTTIGMGLGAGIGAIALALTGPSITNKMEQAGKDDNSWYNSIRYGGIAGEGMGTLVGYGFEETLEGSQQLGANVGTLMTGGIGFCYYLWKQHQNKTQGCCDKESNGQDQVPWSQRINLFAACGTVLGSIIGVFSAGPVGMLIGGAVGAIVGSIVGLVAGNYICNKLMHFGNWLTKKIECACCDDDLDEEKPQPVQNQNARPTSTHAIQSIISKQNRPDFRFPPKSAPIPIPHSIGEDTSRISASMPICMAQTQLSSSPSGFVQLTETYPGAHNGVRI